MRAVGIILMLITGLAIAGLTYAHAARSRYTVKRLSAEKAIKTDQWTGQSWLIWHTAEVKIYRTP